MSVNTKLLKDFGYRMKEDDDELLGNLCWAAADENDALRKRIQQLERLVCSSLRIEQYRGKFELWRNDSVECIGIFNDKQAAIDAAIAHMEKEAGDD